MADLDVTQRFAPLVDEFVHRFPDEGDEAAELCLYVDGRKVVDVSGGPCAPGGLQVVRSASKGVMALLAAVLHEKGVVDLDAPVADVWPGFEAGGKQDITTRLLLTHQAGLPVFGEPISAADALAWDPAVEMLERQEPLWKPGTRHGYHDLTFGWLVGEVLRRASGSDVGKLISTEFSEKLGLDLWLGTPFAELSRVRPWRRANRSAPRVHAPSQFDSSLLAGALGNPDLAPVEHSIEYLTAEVPAANCVTDARSLCRLFAASVSTVDGVRLLADASLRAAVAPRAEGPDLVVGWYRRYASGFMLPEETRPMGGADTACFGHYGQGGVLVFAHPESGTAFAFTTTTERSHLGADPSTSSLSRIALECATRS